MIPAWRPYSTNIPDWGRHTFVWTEPGAGRTYAPNMNYFGLLDVGSGFVATRSRAGDTGEGPDERPGDSVTSL